METGRGSSSSQGVCSSYRLIVGTGTILLITGLALFILHSCHPTFAASGFSSTAMACVAVGLVCISPLIFSVVTSHRMSAFEHTGMTRSPKTEPKALFIDTQYYLRSQGLFGTPDDLIHDINQWRQYRLQQLADIPPNIGFLFHGDSGLGKSATATAIADLLGGTLYRITTSIQRGIVGQTEQTIADLFDVPPGEFRVILIDEIETFLPNNRGSWAPDHTASTRSSFLQSIPGSIEDKQPRRYICIGTTNKFNSIDPVSYQGRLKPILFEVPRKAALFDIMQYQFQSHAIDLDVNMRVLLDAAAGLLFSLGYSGAKVHQDIMSIVQRAHQQENRRLTTEDFPRNWRRNAEETFVQLEEEID